MVTVAKLVSFIQGDVPLRVYKKVLEVAPEAGVKVPAPALNVPPEPVGLVQIPPACSPVINPNKLIRVTLELQIVVFPSAPALGCGFMIIVTKLVSFIQGAVPVRVYKKVLEVAAGAGVKVPAPALNVPPVPVGLVQIPPACSPVINPNKLIAVTLVSQMVVLPSVPALGCGFMVIVTKLVSFIQGAVPMRVYKKVLEVAPEAGVKVPAPALNVPPVPVGLVQIPPACSPVINPNKLIAVTLESQIVVLPSVPALGCVFMVTVAKLVSLIHGDVPVRVYKKVLEVAPEAGVKVPDPALNVPPVPVGLVQIPSACSPVIKLNKSMDATLESQMVTLPFAPALGCGFMVIVTKLVSFIQGAVPMRVYKKVLEMAPEAGVKVPAPALNVPPEPVGLVQIPPACSPVINPNKLIAVTLESQMVVFPSVPALGCAFMVTLVVTGTAGHPALAGMV
jgi:hypothetical protein